MTSAFTAQRLCADSAPIGDCFALETTEQPDPPRRDPRVHRHLAVGLHVTEGVVYVVAGDDEHVLTPGGEVTIRAGTPYRRWNAGDGTATWVEVYERAY